MTAETRLSRLSTHIVPPDGPLDAKICFIGEAPGAEEDARLRPFIGAAGQFFDRCLSASGIARHSVLVTNIFSQRPPKNVIDYYYQDSKKTRLTWEGQEHLDQLRKWLEKLAVRPQRPNVLVALGDTAMRHLTGKSGITKWRGSVLPCVLAEGFKVYCSYHPSFVMRLINEPTESLQGEQKKQQQNAYALFMIDLDRIKQQAEFSELRYPERVFYINLSYEEILSKLESLYAFDTVACDIETIPTPNGPILWCIGFSPRPDYAFVVPILRSMRFAWSLEQEARLMQSISRVFLNPKVLKVFQGGLYDLSILGRYYSLRLAPNSYADTMFCHHATYPYLPKALRVQTSIYTWEPYYKDEGRLNFGSRTDESEFIYNCKDCCVTREIWPIVARNAQTEATWHGYERTISITPSLLAMAIRGVKIDTKKKEKLNEEFHKKALLFQQLVSTETGQDWNVNSSAQMQVLLYGLRSDGGLGLTPQYSRKTGRPTTDQDALKHLVKKYPQIKVLKHILNCRKFSKLASTYTDMIVDSDGRVHTSYGIVSTWRLSSSESPFGGGGNLQNIPVRSEEGKLIRELFIADEDKVLISCDLSQAEARVVAWEAGDMRQMELFQSGGDIHWENTKLLFSMDDKRDYIPTESFPDVVSGQLFTLKQLRDIGKTVVHAGNYGMGWAKLQMILAANGFFFEAASCKQLIMCHQANNPSILSWQQAIRDEVRSKRILISAFDRKREFFGRLNDSLYRSAYAFSPQNTVGELLQVAIQKVHANFGYIDILLNVHDELLCQTTPDRAPRAIEDLRSCMEIPLSVRDRTMPSIRRELIIPCDFKIGLSWGKATKDIDSFLKTLS